MTDAAPHVAGLVDRVITHGATEHHDRTTVAADAPLVGVADGERGVGECEPVVAGAGRSHGA